MKLFDSQGLPKDGRAGPAGTNGTSGADGPAGPAIFLAAEDGEDGWHAIPGKDGAPGAAGTNGTNGATGPAGPAGPAGPVIFLLADDGEDGMMGPPGVGGSSTPVTSLVNVTADTHPSSPTSSDDEFEFGATIDTTGARFPGATPWTVLNFGTQSNTVGQGSLVAHTGTVGNLLAFVQAAPGGSYEFTAKVAGAPNSAVFLALVFRNTANNNEIIIGIIPNNYLLVQRQTNNYSTGASTFNSAPYSTNLSPYIGAWANPIYLRGTYNGTTLVLSVSATGINGTFLPLVTETVASFLGAITHVGLYTNSSPTTNGYPSCDWFRRTA